MQIRCMHCRQLWESPQAMFLVTDCGGNRMTNREQWKQSQGLIVNLRCIVSDYAMKRTLERGVRNRRSIRFHTSSYRYLIDWRVIDWSDTFQINLEQTHVITAIETQGRFGNGTGREFAQLFMIDYLRPATKWIRYRNRTGHTVTTNYNDLLIHCHLSWCQPIGTR